VTPLHIHLLGEFRLDYGDRPVTAITSPKVQALLSYLVLRRHAPETRQRLAFLFWPDSHEVQARTNLRRELFHLRQLLPEGERFIAADAKTLQWRPDAPFTLDVGDFERTLARAQDAEKPSEARRALEEAARLYRGELLPGLYDEWLLSERERLHQMAVEALERLVRLLEDERDYRAATGHAKRLLQLDPLHEATYRRLMRLHALSGDRAGALHVYHSCATVLARELGAEPSLATLELYEQLLHVGDAATPPMRGRVASATLKLVGRHEEWEALLAAWRRAARGQAQLLVITGEAGIGKTRLAEEVLEWTAQQGLANARTRCYAAEGRLAYAPVAELLRKDALRAGLSRLEDVWLREVARLLPELAAERPDLPRAEPLTGAWQRRCLFEALARAVLVASQPLLLFIDDLQWCDRDTLEWLHYLLRFDLHAKLLVVGTVRSEEVADNGALSSLLLDLRKEGQLIEIALGPLDLEETAELAAAISGRELEAELQTRFFQETEGQPLFVVETARAGFELKDDEGATPSGLPPKVQAVIKARLAQLSPQARELVAVAATVGRDFSFDVLAQASDLDEEGLVRALDELWGRRIVREQSMDSYDFSHDRIREVAYLDVSPIKRRLLHRRVAQALELLHAADLDDVSAPLATHYERAGQLAKALRFYERAAEVARRVYANEEAIRLLSRALALLEGLPHDLERDRQELALQVALSTPLNATQGYTSAALERALQRVRSLGSRLGEHGPLIHSLVGLFAAYLVRGDIRCSYEFGEEALKHAQNEAALRSEAHLALGGSLVSLGELTRAKDHFEQAILLNDYDSEQWSLVFGASSKGFSHAWGAHALWLLGYPERAKERSQEAIAYAEKLEHPYSLVVANAYGAILFQLRGDLASCRRHAEAARELCAKYGFAYYIEWGAILGGWLLAQEGAYEAGVTETRRGLENLQSAGAEFRRPYYLSLLADACRDAGRLDEAREAIGEALATAERHHELWWSAELHRLKGELSAPPSAEACFHKALKIARHQESKSLELKAALSLGRLWRAQGKTGKAQELVKSVYAWFSEGFDTADLQEARVFLGE
jgi:DNA-binding SARP family transcriptional activator/predicted ATPase